MASVPGAANQARRRVSQSFGRSRLHVFRPCNYISVKMTSPSSFVLFYR